MLSVVVACVGSWTALDLFRRVHAHTGPWRGAWLAAAAVFAAAALWLGLLHWINTHSPRARVRTWLAMALAPLDPTEAEIRQARLELQAHRMGAGFKMSPTKLRGRIERIRRSGMVPG